MKSRSEIWLRALEELGAQCSVNTQRDAETLAKRVAREGDEFLLVTLPSFGKDFELSLSLGTIPHHAFHGFKRSKLEVDILSDDIYRNVVGEHEHKWGNPRFLGGFLDLVFRDTLQMNAAEYASACIHQSFMLRPVLRVSDTTDLMRMADAVAAIRQLTLMFGKEKEQCAPDRTVAAIRAFIETDKELDGPLGTSGLFPFSKGDGSQTSEGLPG